MRLMKYTDKTMPMEPVKANFKWKSDSKQISDHRDQTFWEFSWQTKSWPLQIALWKSLGLQCSSQADTIYAIFSLLQVAQEAKSHTCNCNLRLTSPNTHIHDWSGSCLEHSIVTAGKSHLSEDCLACLRKSALSKADKNNMGGDFAAASSIAFMTPFATSTGVNMCPS